MKHNYLGFLSLLSLIGVLGIVTTNKDFLGFWGFAYYVRYFFVIPDEMFQQNIKQAASIGFFSGVATTSILVVGSILLPQIIIKEIALVSNFVVSVICFTFALVWLELKEMRGC